MRDFLIESTWLPIGDRLFCSNGLTSPHTPKRAKRVAVLARKLPPVPAHVVVSVTLLLPPACFDVARNKCNSPYAISVFKLVRAAQRRAERNKDRRPAGQVKYAAAAVATSARLVIARLRFLASSKSSAAKRVAQTSGPAARRPTSCSNTHAREEDSNFPTIAIIQIVRRSHCRRHVNVGGGARCAPPA